MALQSSLTEVWMVFDVLNAGCAMHLRKKVVMPILPVGSYVDAWDPKTCGPGDDHIQDILFWSYEFNGDVLCHFDNPGFDFNNISYLTSRGYQLFVINEFGEGIPIDSRDERLRKLSQIPENSQ